MQKKRKAPSDSWITKPITCFSSTFWFSDSFDKHLRSGRHFFFFFFHRARTARDRGAYFLAIVGWRLCRGRRTHPRGCASVFVRARRWSQRLVTENNEDAPWWTSCWSVLRIFSLLLFIYRSRFPERLEARGRHVLSLPSRKTWTTRRGSIGPWCFVN